MLSIDFRADLSGMQRALFALRADQVPFASALALTALARGVANLEREEVKETFENPTPFTQNAWRVKAATKNAPIAYILAKDIQAAYLDPYVRGGKRSLGTKKGMLVPNKQEVNQYGNLPRNTLRRLAGRKDVFAGPMKTKTGQVVSGIWKWAPLAKGAKVRPKSGGPAVARPGMELLIRFADTSEAPEHLPFYETARAYVRANAKREFDAAFRKALASRKR